jgi:hypothetical protein
MIFGLVGDILFGLFVVVLIGKFLDHRKHRWTGKRYDPALPKTSRAPPMPLGPAKSPTLEIPLKVKRKL